MCYASASFFLPPRYKLPWPPGIRHESNIWVKGEVVSSFSLHWLPFLQHSISSVSFPAIFSANFMLSTRLILLTAFFPFPRPCFQELDTQAHPYSSFCKCKSDQVPSFEYLSLCLLIGTGTCFPPVVLC